MYFVSINAGAQLAIILLACGPCVVIVNCLGQVLYLGRAPRTKETLPYFCEWCRVTRHPRLFHRLTDCQRYPPPPPPPPVLGRHNFCPIQPRVIVLNNDIIFSLFMFYYQMTSHELLICVCYPLVFIGCWGL